MQTASSHLSYSNENLISHIKNLVSEERKLTADILESLREVERRKLFLEMGYSSLFDFCVKELGYAESSAFRRISAMRLIKDVPEVQNKILSGELSLSVVAQAQSFFKKQDKKKEAYGKHAKLDLLEKLGNTSVRECEKMLLKIDPAPVRKDIERAVTEELTELRLTVNAEFMQKIIKLKNLLSNTKADLSTQEILIMALDQLLAKKAKSAESAHVPYEGDASVLCEGDARVSHEGDARVPSSQDAQLLPAQEVDSQHFHRPQRSRSKPDPDQFSRSHSRPHSRPHSRSHSRPHSKSHAEAKSEALSTSTHRTKTKNSRYISAEVKRQVWKKSKSRCCYVDLKTGRRCDSQKFLHFDHIHAYSRGGTNTPDNLQLLCSNHNLWKADSALTPSDPCS